MPTQADEGADQQVSQARGGCAGPALSAPQAVLPGEPTEGLGEGDSGVFVRKRVVREVDKGEGKPRRAAGAQAASQGPRAMQDRTLAHEPPWALREWSGGPLRPPAAGEGPCCQPCLCPLSAGLPQTSIPALLGVPATPHSQLRTLRSPPAGQQVLAGPGPMPCPLSEPPGPVPWAPMTHRQPEQ